MSSLGWSPLRSRYWGERWDGRGQGVYPAYQSGYLGRLHRALLLGRARSAIRANVLGALSVRELWRLRVVSKAFGRFCDMVLGELPGVPPGATIAPCHPAAIATKLFAAHRISFSRFSKMPFAFTY